METKWFLISTRDEPEFLVNSHQPEKNPLGSILGEGRLGCIRVTVLEPEEFLSVFIARRENVL